jgi:hypothetical protein
VSVELFCQWYFLKLPLFSTSGNSNMSHDSGVQLSISAFEKDFFRPPNGGKWQ